MRLFLFLVGGTGSRVMRPLIMQFAAGVHPLDSAGNPIPLEVIPIIVDPHTANEDLKRTNNLLRWYKQLRKMIYGDTVDIRDGFFSVRISSLSDLIPNGGNLSDTFLFNMSEIESKTFQDFISYSTLDTANQALASMLFSNDQLNTKMDIGFVGSPNIGAVALNKFKDSEEFRQFSNIFQDNDRIFVVSSIFGGTGAAGYPIIVKNIRNAGNNQNINNRGALRDAKIGALTVLPYFNIQQKADSPITRADFISKTKSALYYYHDNLTGLKRNGVDSPLSKINACYYLGDEVPSNPYFNDPGENGQRNDAHFVEFIGALSVIDFLQIPDNQLISVDGNARNTIYKEYGLAKDNMVITLKDLGTATRNLVNKQLVKFHLAYMYITNQLKDDIGRGYTEDKPELKKSFLSSTFYNVLTTDFFVGYRVWLKELKGNHRSFQPFNIDTDKLSVALKDIPAKGGLFKSKIDYNSVLSTLNKVSQQAAKMGKYDSNNQALKLMDLLNKALDGLVEDKFDSIV